MLAKPLFIRSRVTSSSPLPLSSSKGSSWIAPVISPVFEVENVWISRHSTHDSLRFTDTLVFAFSSLSSSLHNELLLVGHGVVIHGALNVLRRERDEKHRRKDLAVERCRLMTEEKESVAKNAATMKERLETTQGSLAPTKRDLAPREASVQNLSKQVKTRMEWNGMA
jgi:hypothetical protein